MRKYWVVGVNGVEEIFRRAKQNTPKKVSLLGEEMEDIEQVIEGLTILKRYINVDTPVGIESFGDFIHVHIDRLVDSPEDYNRLKDLYWWQDEELDGELTWLWR